MRQPVHAIVMRRFDVPAERVFDACLDPAWVRGWMLESGDGNGQVVRLDLEAKVGGRFSFMINRSGKNVEHVGEYREIDRPDLLVFTWTAQDRFPDRSRVIIEIAPCHHGCEVKLTHVMGDRWSSVIDQSAGVWAKRLDLLERTLVQADIVPTV